MPAIIGEFDIVNEVQLAPASALYDGSVVADGDLSVQVHHFYYEISGTHGYYLGSVGNAVANNSINYVYLIAGGTLVINTMGYPGGAHIRLARVLTQGGFILRVILERAFLVSGGGGVAANAKAGILIPANFAGNPKKATVIFVTPYLSTNYAVVFSPITDGTKVFSLSAESKTVNGFTVNLNSNNISGFTEAGWHTLIVGE